MDLDEVLPDVGPFGLYQKLQLGFVLLPAVFPCAFFAYSQLFMASRPAHWCQVPQLELMEEQVDWVKNISIPLEPHDGSTRFSECLVYVRNYSEIISFWNNTDPLPVPGNSSILEDWLDLAPIEGMQFCQHGWRFDRSQYIDTVITEWNLVCEKDFYTTMALVLFGVGGLIGNFIFGYIQDQLGRRPAFFLYLLIGVFFGTASAFCPNFTTWTLCRTAVGFTVPAILSSPIVLAIELVGPDHRALCTVLSNIAYTLALVFLAVTVYLVREWRLLAIVTSTPFALFFLYWWCMPESPRWLLARGHYDEAEKILRTMAKVNGKVLPESYMSNLKRKFNISQTKPKSETDSERTKYGVVDLFRTPNMRSKTLIITFIWFTNTSVYVGLSYYAPALGGDEFWNFFLAGVAELPTYLFLLPALNRAGRRWTLCVSMVVGGLACLMTFLVQNSPAVTLTLYCVGKMGISSAFVVLPLAASELYPTVVRGLGMSTSSVVGMLGPVVIPLVNYLGSDMMVLPLIIMGALLVLGGFSSLLLPETLGQPMPQTLLDGEAMGLMSPFPCHRRAQQIKRNNKRSQNVMCDSVELR